MLRQQDIAMELTKAAGDDAEALERDVTPATWHFEGEYDTVIWFLNLGNLTMYLKKIGCILIKIRAFSVSQISSVLRNSGNCSVQSLIL